MNNLPYYLSRIYYSLINTTYPGYTGESAEYWSARIFYAVAGIQVTTYADGRDASFWLEKWYRYLAGQSNFNPQGGQDSAVWLQKIYWHYAGVSGDAIYDGRSSEFWASLIVSLNPSNQLPPTINDAVFSVADSESVGFDVGTPTATGSNLTWSITAGNGDGKFSINASTGLITLAATVDHWTTPQYVLTVKVQNTSGQASASITINVAFAYLLRGGFNTDDAAPIADPYTLAVNTIDPVQVDGQMSVLTNVLTAPAQASPVEGDQGFVSGSSFARSTGLMFGIRVRYTTSVGTPYVRPLMLSNANRVPTSAQISTDITTSIGVQLGGGGGFFIRRFGNFIIFIPNTGLSVDTDYDVVFIMRSSGNYLLGRGGALGSTFLIIWVDAFDSTTPLYAVFSQVSLPVELRDNLMVQRFGGAIWTDDYGVITQRLAGARSAGDTFTHTADCFIEFTLTTLPSASLIDFRFRIQDANNYWQITISSVGTITLNEVVAGVPTVRGTAATALANGDRVCIRCIDARQHVISGAVGSEVNRIDYTSSGNFKTATNGKLESLGTGGAIANIVSYPRVLTGTALVQVNEAFGV